MTSAVLPFPQPKSNLPFDPQADLRDLVPDGHSIERPLVFADDTWHLTGHPTIGVTASRIHFSAVPARHRDQLKLFTLLNGAPSLALEWSTDTTAAARWATRTAHWGTAKSYAENIRTALIRLNNGKAPDHLDARDWDDITTLLTEGLTGPDGTELVAPYQSRKHATGCGVRVRMWHDVMVMLGQPAPFGTRPWGRDEIGPKFGYIRPRLGEARNVTQANGSMFVTLGACLSFIDAAADDIISRVAHWSQRELQAPKVKDRGVIDGWWFRRLCGAYEARYGQLPVRPDQFGQHMVVDHYTVLQAMGYEPAGVRPTTIRNMAEQASNPVPTNEAYDPAHDPDFRPTDELEDPPLLAPTPAWPRGVVDGRWFRRLCIDYEHEYGHLPVSEDRNGNALVDFAKVLNAKGYTTQHVSVDIKKRAAAKATNTVPTEDVDFPRTGWVGEAPSRPSWLPDDASLLPSSSYYADGWTIFNDALVTACVYVLAGVACLRDLEIGALSPDCIERRPDGRIMLHGRKVKNQDVYKPPEISWYVNEHVAAAVEVLQRLHAAHGLKQTYHDRIPDLPVLLSSGLLTGRGSNLRPTDGIEFLLDTDRQTNKLLPMLRRLGTHGLYPELPDKLDVCNHRTINQTALDTVVDRAYGDMALTFVRRHSTMHVRNMYGGHRPQIITPHPDRLAEHITKNPGEVGKVVQLAAENADAINGNGAHILTGMAADARIDSRTTIAQLDRLVKKGKLKMITVGPFGACTGPEGGKCGDGPEANHRRCVIDCRKIAFRPYDRAALEYQRRANEKVLGPHARAITKLDKQPDLLAAERAMSDDELFAVLAEGWEPDWARILTESLARWEIV